MLAIAWRPHRQGGATPRKSQLVFHHPLPEYYEDIETVLVQTLSRRSLSLRPRKNETSKLGRGIWHRRSFHHSPPRRGSSTVKQL